MYGMVNNALQELANAQLGPDAWPRIVVRAQLPSDIFFLSLDPYPDEVTTQLVGATAVEFGMSVEAFLEAFGRFWIEYAQRTAYGPLLKRAGASLGDTLRSLDGLHSRIHQALPKLRPPSFEIEEDAEGITVRYRSSREGLAPFVIGLLQGLAAMHRQTVRVSHAVRRSAGVDHDEFRVEPLA